MLIFGDSLFPSLTNLIVRVQLKSQNTEVRKFKFTEGRTNLIMFVSLEYIFSINI